MFRDLAACSVRVLRSSGVGCFGLSGLGCLGFRLFGGIAAGMRVLRFRL